MEQNSSPRLYYLEHNFFQRPKNRVPYYVWARGQINQRRVEKLIREAPQRTVHVWLTFKEATPYKAAKERALALVRKRLRGVIESAYWVMEKQGNGHPHLHWIIRLVESARACGRKLIGLALKWHGSEYGIGRSGVEMIWDDGRLAAYVTKAFRDRSYRIVGMRIIGFWCCAAGQKRENSVRGWPDRTDDEGTEAQKAG
jgi:hypothetical protein